MRLAGLHPGLREAADYAMRWAEYYGVSPEIQSVYRSWQDQAQLHSRYRAAVANGTFPSASVPYPANAPGDSAHNYGLAWDAWVPERYMQWWIEVRRAIGWQVYEHDAPHAELPNWRHYVT